MIIKVINSHLKLHSSDVNIYYDYVLFREKW